MIKRIIVSMFLFCLIIAIPLAMFGIKHVELGPSFISFLKRTSLDLEVWKLDIPDIPNIPKVPPDITTDNFLEVLVNILNAIITFFNFLIATVNVLLRMLNIVVQFTQYLFTLIKNLIAFKDTLARIGTH